MKAKSFEKQERMLSHRSLIWKLGMLLILVLFAMTAWLIGISNIHADSSNGGQRVSSLDATTKNLISSSGQGGARQVDNDSSSTDSDAWKNSGGISLPYSYPQYQNSNNAIAPNLGTIHNRLERQYVGKDALKFNIKDPNAQIAVQYKNAMTYTTYQKDSDGNWQKQKHSVSVAMVLNQFNFYPSDYWSGTPNVFVSKNFAQGIYYNGISKMSAQYSYYDENGNPLNMGKDSYLTTHGLNGVATPDSHFLSKTSSGYSRGENYNVRFRLLPFYYTATWMQEHNDSKADNEKFFAGNNGVNKYKEELFDNKYDSYGKFVTSTDGTIGTPGRDKDNLPQTSQYYVPGVGPVISGNPNSAYKGDRNDNGHAVTFDISHRNQTNLILGSSTGYGNFSLSADTVLDKPKDENNQTPNTPIQKSVDKSTIHHQGDNITYTLKGTLPNKKITKERVQSGTHPVTHKVYQGKKKGWQDVTTPEPSYKWVETNTHDYYNFTDNVPKDASVTSVSSSGGLNATTNGDQVTAHANNNQLKANSGSPYTIKIHAKVDNLPQPGPDGWSNDPTDNGYYKFYNKATADQTVYSNSSTSSSNQVSTQIKRYEGTAWHYDFDNNEGGDFDFMDHGPDGDGNFSYSDNFDPDQGVIQSDKVYGYENDTKNVNILTNADKDDNPQWQYRYAYGNQTSANITFNDPGDDGDGTTQDFYFPYIVPRSQLTNSLITVDTDKRSNNLPFTLDMKGESFLYRDFSDYSGADVTVNVSAPNGSILWSQTKPLTSLLAEGQHAINWTQWQGRLNTAQLNVGDGSRIPLNVQVTSNNPQLIQQDTTPYTSTYGFTANSNQVKDKSFDKNDNAIFTSPQETLKYNGIGEPRVLSEALSIHQPRNASGKTGYGLRQGNDLSLEYAGNINTKNYLDSGTGLDYGFSSSYNNANSGIDYSNDPRNHTYNVPNQTNDQGMQKQQGGLVDRFNQTNHYNGNDYSELNDKSDLDTSQLDTYNQMGSDGQTTVASINNEMPLSYSQYIQPSSFRTSYDFAPRFTERGSGNVFLTQGTQDVLAHNRTTPDYNGIDAGQRMYTPYFMPLGKYDTYYSKADTDDSHRLGANWFDIDENRPTDFYGHMYLTANSAAGVSDQNDELSIQPIISHQQNVNGFSDQENQWLKDQSGYFNK